MIRRNGPWTILDSTVVYENPWIRVRHDVVETPAGTPGVYGVVETRPAVGIVALDDGGMVYLVGQHRYPHGVYSWEIPEGAAADGEQVDEAARRELAEETGFTAARWTPLGTMHTSNCIMDEVAHFFLAEGLRLGPAAPDETEQLSVRRVSLVDAVEMARTGEIQDAMSIVALLRAADHLHGPGS